MTGMSGEFGYFIRICEIDDQPPFDYRFRTCPTHFVYITLRLFLSIAWVQNLVLRNKAFFAAIVVDSAVKHRVSLMENEWIDITNLNDWDIQSS